MRMPTQESYETYEGSDRIKQFNAWFFDRFEATVQDPLKEIKSGLYRDLPDTIVEIGPGVGANFPHYPAGATVVAVEPNPRMHGRLRQHADRHGINLVLEEGVAEATTLMAGSADAVVSSYVLCTVVDPAAAVQEAKRILRSGGRFLVVEHVVGCNRTTKVLQRAMRRPWRWVWEGCDLQRDTARVIGEAGFSEVNLTRTFLRDAVPMIGAHIYGEAIK
jgi:SAM-dependent methyltransferase